MADPQRRTDESIRQPPGVEGEGLDRYPTYRDGPAMPHPATTTKPTDVGLPQAGRTNWLPIFIGLIAFAVIVLGYIIWGGVELLPGAENPATSGESTPPAAGEPAAGATTTGAAPQSPGSFDTDVGVDTQSGPGEVEQSPGPVDVPGGETTTPVEPAPAQ
jgi:hypothetical protein